MIDDGGLRTRRLPSSAAIVGLPVGALVIGIALMLANMTAPRFLKADWMSEVKDGDSPGYYRAYDQFVNPAAQHFDLGASLVSLAVSVLALIAITRTWNSAQLKALATPRRKWMFYAGGNLAWFALIQAEWFFVVVQEQRQLFAPWSDSLAIPAAALGGAYILGAVLLNIGLALYLYRCDLPASFWQRPRRVRAWILSSVAAVLAVVSLIQVSESVAAGDWLTIPPMIAILYFLLAGRAASATVGERS